MGEQSGDVEIKAVSVQNTEAVLEAEIETLAENKEQRQFLERVKNELLEAEKLDPGSVKTAGIEQKVLLLPVPLRNWLTQHLTRALLRDVHEFFYIEARREVMRKSLLSWISVGGGPFVVIGHSQGSMIAYDVLLDLAKRDANVPLFVTLGSPLGLQEVQDQFKRFRKTRTLKVPACVGDWLNVADRIDPVALDKSLSSEFTPKKFIKDVRIWNKRQPARSPLRNRLPLP